MEETNNENMARRYLEAIERGALGEELAAFFTPDATQHQYPNKLVPAGLTSDLAAMKRAAEQGQRAVEKQRYQIRHVVASGDEVAMEVDWSAVLKVPLGQSAAGATIRAAFGMFLTFRDGRIASQRNYDCFDPF